MLDEAEAAAYANVIEQNFPGQDKIKAYTDAQWQQNPEAYHEFLRRNNINVAHANSPRMQQLYSESLQVGIIRDLRMATNNRRRAAITSSHGIQLSRQEQMRINTEATEWLQDYQDAFKNDLNGSNPLLTITPQTADAHRARTLQETGIAFNMEDSRAFIDRTAAKVYDTEKLAQARALEALHDSIDFNNPINATSKGFQLMKCRAGIPGEVINGKTVQATDIVISHPHNTQQVFSQEEFDRKFFRIEKGTRCIPKEDIFYKYFKVTKDVYKNGELKYKKGTYVSGEELFAGKIYDASTETLDELRRTNHLYDSKNQRIEELLPENAGTTGNIAETLPNTAKPSINTESLTVSSTPRKVTTKTFRGMVRTGTKLLHGAGIAGGIADGVNLAETLGAVSIPGAKKAETAVKTGVYFSPAWGAAMMYDIATGTDERTRFQIGTKEGQEKAAELLEDKGYPAGLSRRYVTDLANTMNQSLTKNHVTDLDETTNQSLTEDEYVSDLDDTTNQPLTKHNDRVGNNLRRVGASFGFTPAFTELHKKINEHPQAYFEQGLSEGNFFMASTALGTGKVELHPEDVIDPINQGDADMTYLIASQAKMDYQAHHLERTFQFSRGIDTGQDVGVTMLQNCTRKLDGAELDSLVETTMMSRRDGNQDSRLTPTRLDTFMKRYETDGAQMSGQTFCRVLDESKNHTASAELATVLAQNGLGNVEITPEVVSAIREAPESVRGDLIEQLRTTDTCQQNPDLLKGLETTVDKLANGETVEAPVSENSAESTRAYLQGGKQHASPSTEGRGQTLAYRQHEILEERVYLDNGHNLRLTYDSEEAYKNHQPQSVQYNDTTIGMTNISDDMRNQYAMQDTTRYGKDVFSQNDVVKWDDEKGWTLTPEAREEFECDVLSDSRHNVEVYDTTDRRHASRMTTGVGQENTQIRHTQNEDGTYTVGYPSRQADTQEGASVGYEEFIYDENHQRIDAYQLDAPERVDPQNPAARYVTYDGDERTHLSWTRAPRHNAWAREEQLKRMEADPENAFCGALRTGDADAQNHLLVRDPTLLTRPLHYKKDGKMKVGSAYESITGSLMRQPAQGDDDRRMQMFRAATAQSTDPAQVTKVGQAISRDAFMKLSQNPEFLSTPQGQTHMNMLKDLVEKHPEQKDAILAGLPKENAQTQQIMTAMEQPQETQEQPRPEVQTPGQTPADNQEQSSENGEQTPAEETPKNNSTLRHSAQKDITQQEQDSQSTQQTEQAER